MKRKRITGWTLAGFVMLLIVVAIAGYFYLKSSRFEHFALGEIEKQADEQPGDELKLADSIFSLRTLSARRTYTTLRCAAPSLPDQPPLLHADKLTVRLEIVSALQHKVTLRELLIDRPVLHLQVGRDGKNNLPTAPPSQNSSHTSVFDLGVEHAQLTNGEVDYNDRKTPLEADLYDLGADIHFASGDKRYTGELSYKNGHLRYAEYAPLGHDLDLRFSATSERFEVSPLTLRVGDSRDWFTRAGLRLFKSGCRW